MLEVGGKLKYAAAEEGRDPGLASPAKGTLEIIVATVTLVIQSF